MTTYERITIKGNKRNRTGWYEVMADMGSLVLLRPVDTEGEDRSFSANIATLDYC